MPSRTGICDKTLLATPDTDWRRALDRVTSNVSHNVVSFATPFNNSGSLFSQIFKELKMN